MRRGGGAEETRILMFHRVRPNLPVAFGLPDAYRLRGTSLTPDELERVVARQRRILPLETIEAALSAGQALPPGAALTFDDGYREHLDTVVPMLTAFGHGATFYVATELHGGGDRFAAVDAWYWLLDHAERGWGEVPLPDGTVYAGPLDSIEGKRAWVVGSPKRALLGASSAQQRRMLGALACSAGCELPPDLAERLYLRRSEWPRLSAARMRLGAHSMTHARLTTVDEAALRLEVEDSVRAIREHQHRVPFAYPDGDHDARVVDAVRGSDATSAVTCEAGCVSATSHIFRLPRFFVRPSDV